VTVETVLVLGGGSEIGAAVVAALAPSGVRRVVLAARDPDDAMARVRAALADLGTAGGSGEQVEVVAERWDALDVDRHAAVLASLVDRHGPPDVVVCAVGLLGHHAGLAMGPVEVDTMVRANFAGPAAALAGLAPLLVAAARPATVVVLSSVAAARPRRSNYVYGASKAGLDAFAQGLGDALVDTAVRVVVVRPGFVRSRMTTGLDPAPMWRTPAQVGEAVAAAVTRPGREVVWVPARLGPLMAALGVAPRWVWRRVAADR